MKQAKGIQYDRSDCFQYGGQGRPIWKVIIWAEIWMKLCQYLGKEQLPSEGIVNIKAFR